MIECSVVPRHCLGSTVRSTFLICEFCGKAEMFFADSQMRCDNCNADRYVNPLDLIKNLSLRKKFFLGRN